MSYGLKSISNIPVGELEQIAHENFVEHVQPRLYEGVVEHLNQLKERGTAVLLVSSSPGIVIARVYLLQDDPKRVSKRSIAPEAVAPGAPAGAPITPTSGCSGSLRPDSAPTSISTP